jgi:phosphotransferase system HPr (HPr) family protein
MTFDKTILTAYELKAIEERRYFMGLEQKREVSFEEAMEDFMKNYLAEFKKEKARRDAEAQRQEILKHKLIRSQQVGYDIGEEKASQEWLAYAAIWRKEQEELERSLEHNSFRCLRSVVLNKNGCHVRPSGTLCGIALKYSCQIYASREDMEYFNFYLEVEGKKRPFINVRSILTLLSMAVAQGEEIFFVAYGEQSKEALAEIERVITSKFGEE